MHAIIDILGTFVITITLLWAMDTTLDGLKIPAPVRTLVWVWSVVILIAIFIYLTVTDLAALTSSN